MRIRFSMLAFAGIAVIGLAVGCSDGGAPPVETADAGTDPGSPMPGGDSMPGMDMAMPADGGAPDGDIASDRHRTSFFPRQSNTLACRDDLRKTWALISPVTRCCCFRVNSCVYHLYSRTTPCLWPWEGSCQKQGSATRIYSNITRKLWHQQHGKLIINTYLDIRRKNSIISWLPSVIKGWRRRYFSRILGN